MSKRPRNYTVITSDDLQARTRAQVEAQKIWTALFTTPVHLDAALSKLEPQIKTDVALRLPVLLRRPMALARETGIEVDSPWGDPLAWNGVERLWDRLPGQSRTGTEEDFPPALREAWPERKRAELARVLGSDPGVSVRLSKKYSRESWLEKLAHELPKEGASVLARAQPHADIPSAVVFPEYLRLLGTDSFRRGDFEIQDSGSQLMALFTLWPELYSGLLTGEPGERKKRPSTSVPEWRGGAPRVIDACSGAGGKALAIADYLEGKGRVFAYDVSERKLQALRKRAERAGVRNIQTAVVPEDGIPEEWLKPKYAADRVLVDAPCSGWGVLKRNPDIKWRQTPDELERLPKLQAQLLARYAQLVVPGGVLVYGACTFRKEETTEQVARFDREHSEFESLAGGFYGPFLDSDGFYMHAWRKKQ